ncbi:MAG TPA: RNA polymerase sigma factor [Trebonia sp.]|nr:RNA polymerase sigma factor [Trebonia sp.]
MDGNQTANGGLIMESADFEAAFQEHFTPVYRFICRRVGPDLAEDLAADTFATAYRRRGSYQPGRASLRAWLYGIATNVLRNHWRAEQRLLALDAQLAAEGDGTEAMAIVDVVNDRLLASSLAPRIAAALQRLTAEQREVLLLYAWAELSHEEIAAALEIAPGTARSRLSRARAALRENLGHFDFDLWIFEPPAIGRGEEGRDHA